MCSHILVASMIAAHPWSTKPSCCVANYVCAGRTPEAREAVKQLLKLHPGFRASHANKAFPVRLSDLRNQITAAFREAGLPD